MSPVSILQDLLRRLVLRLVLLLDRRIAGREAWLLARLATMPRDHRHRAALEADLARLRRARAVLDDPESWDDPRFAGLAAQVARVRNDPGRRALARRRIYPWIFFALPAPRPARSAELEAPEGRCTPITAAS